MLLLLLCVPQVARVLAGKKFPDGALERCFEEYDDIGVWGLDNEGGVIFAAGQAQ